MRLTLPSKEQFLFVANLLTDKLFAMDRLKDVRQILVVKLDEIGDMATATHVFALLKAAHPNAEITVLCKPFIQSLIENDPAIDHIITSVSHWNKRYEVVVELRGTWKTLLKSLIYKPMLRLSRAEVRYRNRGRQLHETLTNFEVIKSLLPDGAKTVPPGLYFSEKDQDFAEDFLKKEGIGKFAIIHAGARKKLRQWNPDRFAALVKHLYSKHNLRIVFIGSADEAADVEHIRQMAGVPTHTTIGQFSLSALSCLISNASLYVGNESGPMQIASAFAIPLLALYGPGVPNVFYPRHKTSRVLHHVLSCNPCDQVHCVQPLNPCISLIQTIDATSAADELLAV